MDEGHLSTSRQPVRKPAGWGQSPLTCTSVPSGPVESVPKDLPNKATLFCLSCAPPSPGHQHPCSAHCPGFVLMHIFPALWLLAASPVTQDASLLSWDKGKLPAARLPASTALSLAPCRLQAHAVSQPLGRLLPLHPRLHPPSSPSQFLLLQMPSFRPTLPKVRSGPQFGHILQPCTSAFPAFS